MTKQTLAQRVSAFKKSNAKSGNLALQLTVETIQHAIGDSGDGTVFASLISGMDPAQSKVARAIAAKVGLTIKKDDKAAHGFKVDTSAKARATIKANNAAMAFLANVDSLAASGKTLLGADVKGLLSDDKAQPKAKGFKDAVAGAIDARVKGGKLTIPQAIADLEAILASLKAKVEPAH